jgi:hypothetical protein
MSSSSGGSWDGGATAVADAGTLVSGETWPIETAPAWEFDEDPFPDDWYVGIRGSEGTGGGVIGGGGSVMGTMEYGEPQAEGWNLCHAPISLCAMRECLGACEGSEFTPRGLHGKGGRRMERFAALETDTVLEFVERWWPTVANHNAKHDGGGWMGEYLRTGEGHGFMRQSVSRHSEPRDTPGSSPPISPRYAIPSGIMPRRRTDSGEVDWWVRVCRYFLPSRLCEIFKKWLDLVHDGLDREENRKRHEKKKRKRLRLVTDEMLTLMRLAREKKYEGPIWVYDLGMLRIRCGGQNWTRLPRAGHALVMNGNVVAVYVPGLGLVGADSASISVPVSSSSFYMGPQKHGEPRMDGNTNDLSISTRGQQCVLRFRVVNERFMGMN